MKNQKTKGKPSQTAFFTALRRTLAHREYHDEKFGPDYLAEIFLPAYYRIFLGSQKIRKNAKNKLAAAMPGMNEYIIARTTFFDAHFQDAIKDQIPQIVLLGAGYDSRAYRFARLNRGTKIFDLDAFPTQQRKIKCLNTAHISIPREVHFVPVDFINESLSSVLEKAGYQSQERTLFIWEGVSYYLDSAAVRGTLSFVSFCAPRDSLIAFDYSIPITAKNVDSIYGAGEFINSMQVYHANEMLLFSLRDEDIVSFLADNHLKMLECMDNQAIEQKYLMDVNGSLIGRMSGNFRFASASPQ